MKEYCRKTVNSKQAPAAIGTYSQGVLAQDTYYFSGQIGLNPQTMKLAPTFEEQLQQTLKNIDALLANENISRGHIIKTTIFLTDLEKFPLVNEAYQNFFTKPYPARSCIEASALPKGAQVEIEVIAANNK